VRSHSKALHLPAAEHDTLSRVPLSADGEAHVRMVDRAPEERLRAFGQARVQIAHRPLQVCVVPIWQLLDDLVRSTELRSLAYSFVVVRVLWVSQRNVFAYLVSSRR
jgi:hypothetical protein